MCRERTLLFIKADGPLMKRNVEWLLHTGITSL
nr:MAG TPA: hypothetical protein [Caudoviricetes sp.]